MMSTKLFGIFTMLLLFSGTAFAAACAQQAYAQSCQRCPFDNNTGKMNEDCYNSFLNRGKLCIGGAYPVEAIAYQAGGCPAIDVCISRTETCKALFSSENDEADCFSGQINHCFVQGDICIAAATANCSGTPPEQAGFDIPPVGGWCDGLFFMFVPLLFGFALSQKKK